MLLITCTYSFHQEKSLYRTGNQRKKEVEIGKRKKRDIVISKDTQAIIQAQGRIGGDVKN